MQILISLLILGTGSEYAWTEAELPGQAVEPGTGMFLASGLILYPLVEGVGGQPGPTSRVRVHYSGWQISDGRKFDSSVDRGRPITFPLTGVIPGWTEGLQHMAEGALYKLVIPPDLAYGENPGGGRPGGWLVFDVELLEVVSD